MNSKSTATNVLAAVDFKINGFPVTGAYEARSGSLIAHIKEIPLRELLPPKIKPFVPELAIENIIALYRKDENGKNCYRISAGIDAEVDLSKLPLVGKIFSSDNTLEIGKIKVTAGNTNPKFAIGADIYFGETKLPLDLPLVKPAKPRLTFTTVASDDPEKVASAPVTAKEDDEDFEQPDSLTKWAKLNRSFGPVTLKRIGVQFREGVLTFLLDGTLTLGPLAVSLYNLSASSSLNTFEQRFNLDGLGIKFDKNNIKISGALLRDRTDNSYTGIATVCLPSFSLAALGAYQDIDGQPSFFIFGVLKLTNGIGPAFLQVNGLALGFGYNRELKLPSAKKIKQFPLVSTIIGTGTDNEPDPLTTLKRVKKYIPASDGNMFFAIGIAFSSYKVINGLALLTLSIGKKNQIGLIGLAKYTSPPPETEMPPVVQVELALVASYDMDEGILKIEAVLTDASFIFSSKCRLMGGFAFYSWFKGPNEGDFVLTLGGYHPGYDLPDHYPSADRLGFHWQIMPDMSVKGSMYFALTPNAMMIGGRLEAHFRSHFSVSFDIGIGGARLSGSVDAHFLFYCNFLIRWQPFYYDAEIKLSISIRASFAGFVRFLWCTKSIRKDFNLDLSAHLLVKGPEFSGFARVNWNILSFEIKFGDKPAKPKPLNWNEFNKAFLPSKDKISNLIIAAGLLREIENGQKEKLQIINPASLDVVIHSEIPLKEVIVSSKENQTLLRGTELCIPSMDNKVVEQSILTLKVTKNKNSDEDAIEDVSHLFEFKSIQKPIPTALWDIDPSSKERMKRMLVGCRIRPKDFSAGKTKKEPVSKFAYAISNHTSFFSVDDFTDVGKFALKLKDAADPLSLLLRDQLTPSTRNLLNSYTNEKAPSEELRNGLVKMLNQVLRKDSISLKDNFDGIAASVSMDQFTKQDFGEKNTFSRNWHILSENYPKEIAKRSKKIFTSTTQLKTRRLKNVIDLRNMRDDTQVSDTRSKLLKSMGISVETIRLNRIERYQKEVFFNEQRETDTESTN